MEQKKEENKNKDSIRKKVIEILKDKYHDKFDGFSRKLSLHRGDIPPEYKLEYESLYEEIRKQEEPKKSEESKRADESEQLKKEIEQKNRKIDELTDTLKRLQAEFENYKKRIDKEKIEFVKFAHADIVAKMLPVLDSFEIALKNTTDKEKFVEGIKIIYAQLYSVLEAEGLKPIKAAGEKFDPYKHEVLMKQESDKPDDTILEEFQKGYMLNDKVLRHSKVKVSGK